MIFLTDEKLNETIRCNNIPAILLIRNAIIMNNDFSCQTNVTATLNEKCYLNSFCNISLRNQEFSNMCTESNRKMEIEYECYGKFFFSNFIYYLN